VYTGDTQVGTNRISKVLQGCARVEEWQDARGARGLSLFYVEPALRPWKQVWVTETAQRAGGVKEKHLIARLQRGERPVPRGAASARRSFSVRSHHAVAPA
jgi:hypothetical protein